MSRMARVKDARSRRANLSAGRSRLAGGERPDITSRNVRDIQSMFTLGAVKLRGMHLSKDEADYIYESLYAFIQVLEVAESGY